MGRNYSANAVVTTLAAGCNDTATAVQVTATTGFPAADFILTLDHGTAQQELVLVTNVAGTTLTVTRGYDNTTAQAHSLGAAVAHVHSAIDFRESRVHEAAESGVHGATGDVVGTTDTQALTNKDLSSGTNTFPASLLTASSTATLTNKDLSSGTNTFPSSLATDAEVTSAISTHAAVTATHGATGAVVGTTNTQTLTNKTLTSPTINTPTIASPTFTGDFIGGVRFVEKVLDETVSNSTTFQDDDALTFTVVANARYEVEIVTRFTGTASTGGLKVQLTGPSGATYKANTVDTALPFSIASYSPASGIWPTNENVNASAVIETSATAGSVTLQFAQHTSHAAGVTGKAGGYFIVRRVA